MSLENTIEGIDKGAKINRGTVKGAFAPMAVNIAFF
jgi:hypothetical protein